MKKQDLATLAMIGISTGLLIGGCQQQGQGTGGQGNTGQGNGNQETRGHNMQSFMNSLSPEAKEKFMTLDAQHKKMAMEMANQKCNGKNACKGKGGCATNEHACAGKNACKGKGGQPVDSPDKAVNIQYQHQMEGPSAGKIMQQQRIQTSGVSGDLTPEMQDFYKKLSLEGQRRYLTLDTQHKMMSMQMMQQSCRGKNECKGMGGCKTDDHACAGKNMCKGLGGRPITNPDKAVDAQYNNQFQRDTMNKQMQNR